jgi:hypothetical protein
MTEVTANPRTEGFYARPGFARTGQVTSSFGIASKMRHSLGQT